MKTKEMSPSRPHHDEPKGEFDVLARYPQLNAPQVSRRALLAVSSLLTANLIACGSGGDDGSTGAISSGGGGTPAPTITGMTPLTGTTVGSTTVTITGTNLTATTAVTFGSVAGTSITVLSSTSLTVLTPARVAGVVAVSVTTPSGTATSPANYTYVQPVNGGVVSTLAGSTTQGSANGTGTAASFSNPFGVAVDGSGNVYVGDTYNNIIRKITSAGVVTTFAGSGNPTYVDGTGTAASFNMPTGMAVDSSGNVYVADLLNNMIRKITSAGVVMTLAGSTTQSSANGTGTAASFSNPSGVAVDSSGNVYVADQGNNMIRKITSAGVVTTLAGSTTHGTANGTGTAASFYYPAGVAVDGSGNVYVADTSNHMIRQITSTGVVTTLAGSTTSGTANGTGTAASFYYPAGVAADSSGNVYVADTINYMIRKITSGGVVTTFAGTGSPGHANGTGTAASFNRPGGIAVDSNGIVSVADNYNNMIRKIS